MPTRRKRRSQRRKLPSSPNASSATASATQPGSAPTTNGTTPNRRKARIRSADGPTGIPGCVCESRVLRGAVYATLSTPAGSETIPAAPSQSSTTPSIAPTRRTGEGARPLLDSTTVYLLLRVPPIPQPPLGLLRQRVSPLHLHRRLLATSLTHNFRHRRPLTHSTGTAKPASVMLAMPATTQDPLLTTAVTETLQAMATPPIPARRRHPITHRRRLDHRRIGVEGRTAVLATRPTPRRLLRYHTVTLRRQYRRIRSAAAHLCPLRPSHSHRSLPAWRQPRATRLLILCHFHLPRPSYESPKGSRKNPKSGPTLPLRTTNTLAMAQSTLLLLAPLQMATDHTLLRRTSAIETSHSRPTTITDPPTGAVRDHRPTPRLRCHPPSLPHLFTVCMLTLTTAVQASHRIKLTARRHRVLTIRYRLTLPLWARRDRATFNLIRATLELIRSEMTIQDRPCLGQNCTQLADRPFPSLVLADFPLSRGQDRGCRPLVSIVSNLPTA